MSWNRIRLGDIAIFRNGINFGKESYGKGVSLIGVSDFKNRFYPDYETLDEVKESVVGVNDYLDYGDIVFVRSNGNKELVGRCMVIKTTESKLTYSGFCIRTRIKNKTEHDPIFWTYHFKNISFRKSMSGNAVGTNIQNLSQGMLSNYEAEVPDYNTQLRIASILVNYDNLIENNQKQIKLLEEAAQRLYKEWFVDLRFPGHENVEIVDGVPEGWHYKKISSFGSVITGKTPSTAKSQYYGGEVPFIKIPDMHKGIFPLVTEITLSLEGANSQKNKFIPKNSIIVSCIATVGLVNISVEDCQTNQQINSIVLADERSLYYLYFAMKDLKSLLDGVGSNGATMTNVNKEKFSNLLISCPDTLLLEKYYKYSKPLFDKILNLSKNINYLTEARDRLLPKLMSGEIEV